MARRSTKRRNILSKGLRHKFHARGPFIALLLQAMKMFGVPNTTWEQVKTSIQQHRLWGSKGRVESKEEGHGVLQPSAYRWEIG